MKKYIIVRNKFSEGPKVIAQFASRQEAENYSLSHDGILWVYEMSF